MTFLVLITVLQTLSCLITAVVYLTADRSSRKEYIFLGLLLIISTLSELVQYAFVFALHLSANVIFNASQIAEIILMCLLYRKPLKGTINPVIVDLSAVGLVIFAIVNLTSIQGVDSLNSYSHVPHYIVMIVFTLLYFYSLLKGLPTQRVQTLPMFWINNGVLLYYSGNFFVLIFTDYLVNVMKSDLINPWTYHNFLGILRNILFIVGLWLTRRNLRLV